MHNPPPSLGLTQVEGSLAYAHDRLGTLMRCAHTGPVVELFPGHCVVTSPAAVMEVLRRTGDSFRIPVTARGEDFQGVRGNAQYDTWMGTRKLVGSLLKDATFLDGITDQMANEAVTLGVTWSTRHRIERPVDDLMDLAVRAAARAFFGVDIDERALSSLSKQVQQCSAFEKVNRSSVVVLRPWVRPFVRRYRRQARGFAHLQAAIDELVPQASERSLAGVLRSAGRTEKQIANAGIAMLRAGSEGPAGGLAWGVHALAAGVITAEDLTDPTRSALVLREVMRLWPPIWLIRRRATHDTTVAGYSIPAGTEISVSPYATQRSAPDYPDPEEFRPERWHGLRPEPGAYLPYGAGPHWCVGMVLAEAERAVVLATLAQRFTFSRHSPLEPVPVGTLRPRDETVFVTARRDRSPGSDATPSLFWTETPALSSKATSTASPGLLWKPQPGQDAR